MARATRDRPPGRGKRRPRRRTTAIAGTLVVLATLWLVYWYGASQIGAAVLDRVIAGAATRGYVAECQDVSGGGFPLSLDLACSRASVADANGGVSAAVEGFSATTPLYWPGRIEWAARGPLVVDLPASTSDVTAEWHAAETRLDAGFDGLSGAAVRLDDLRIAFPSPPDLPLLQGASISRANMSVSPGSGTDYRLSATANAIALDMPGRTVPEITIAADMTALSFGGSLGLDPRQALRQWLADGGSLRIDDLAVATDEVTTTSSGSLTVSPQGTLSGDLDVTIAGVEKLPELVQVFDPRAGEKATQIVAAVVAFTKPVETPDGPARQMKLLVRDGVVSIGILPIGVIPPIAF